MKTFTLTLLFSLSALLSMASSDYTSSTYTVFGATYTFTHKYDLGDNNYVFDCYTENGQNLATLVRHNSPSNPLYVKARYHVHPPTEVTYNGKTYTVTKIADRAFCFEPNNIKGVVIPSTITDIGNEAFYYLEDLSQVDIMDGVKRIGLNAFRHCESLTRVNIGNSVEIIESSAFRDCPWLHSINFPSSLTILGDNVIEGSARLSYIDWDLDPKKIKISLAKLGSSINWTFPIVHTKTREQANDASKIFDRVVCDEDKAYIEGLEKNIADNNTTIENLASQYTMMQQESQVLQVHNNNLNDCDVNQDGLVNSTDVVTVYNRIIQGGTSSYNGQSYVDLGLPSGTLWATCNVGAPSPECVGDYFAWGENGFYSYRYGLAFGKLEFTEKTYVPAPGVEDIVNGEWPQEYSPLKVIYIAQWDGWKIPTYDQARELTNNCTKEVVTVNGQECLELTSKINKRKIYFPLNGKIDGTSAKETNEVCYWTSSTGSSKYYAYIIPFRLHSIYLTEDRYLGMGIRPVIMKEDVEK